MSRKSTIMVKRSIYQMGVVTVTASVIWIGVAIYQTLVTPVDVNVPVEMLKPLSPVLSGETLTELTTRRQMENQDWSSLSKVQVRESSSSGVAQR